MVQLHEMAMKDGKMVMQEKAGGINVPADSHAHLSPGGDHVMLMGLKQPLKPGDEVPVTLKFSDGTSHDLTVPVKAFTEEEEHYHPSDTPSPSDRRPSRRQLFGYAGAAAAGAAVTGGAVVALDNDKAPQHPVAGSSARTASTSRPSPRRLRNMLSWWR